MRHYGHWRCQGVPGSLAPKLAMKKLGEYTVNWGELRHLLCSFWK